MQRELDIVLHQLFINRHNLQHVSLPLRVSRIFGNHVEFIGAFECWQSGHGRFNSSAFSFTDRGLFVARDVLEEVVLGGGSMRSPESEVLRLVVDREGHMLVVGVGFERVLDVLLLFRCLLRRRIDKFTVVHSDAVNFLLARGTLQGVLLRREAERVVVRRLRIYVSLSDAHSMVGGDAFQLLLLWLTSEDVLGGDGVGADLGQALLLPLGLWQGCVVILDGLERIDFLLN